MRYHENERLARLIERIFTESFHCSRDSKSVEPANYEFGENACCLTEGHPNRGYYCCAKDS